MRSLDILRRAVDGGDLGAHTTKRMALSLVRKVVIVVGVVMTLVH